MECLYRPTWSTRVLEELEYEEAAKLTRRGVPADTAQRRAEKLIAQMAQAFDDATSKAGKDWSTAMAYRTRTMNTWSQLPLLPVPASS